MSRCEGGEVGRGMATVCFRGHDQWHFQLLLVRWYSELEQRLCALSLQ
jgi:hypothetical protein